MGHEQFPVGQLACNGAEDADRAALYAAALKGSGGESSPSEGLPE